MLIFDKLIRYIGFIFSAENSDGEPLQRVKRVYDGRDSSIREFPFMISLEHDSKHWCGGSVVSSKYTLTAAHCVEGLDPSSLKVHAGSVLREQGGSLHQVFNYTMHEDYHRYQSIKSVNDIAVVMLKESITFSRTTKPIVLFNFNEKSKSGSLGTIAGWGAASSFENFANKLQRANLTVIDMEECQKLELVMVEQAFQKGEIYAKNSANNNATLCFRDSGDPLVIRNRLAGVVTLGDCGNPKYPTIASEVAYFRKWIDSAILDLHDNDKTQIL